MACASYLSRREGRYYLQVRLNPTVARLLGKQLYRVSLRTTDYRQARIRLAETIGWVHRMNDSTDFVSLFQKNVRELRNYLQDAWPLSEERLQARRNYEELLKNLTRRAKAAGCDPTMLEPDYLDLFKAFVAQNVDAEAYLRQAEKVQAYERGRADMQAALQVGAVPASFRHHHSALSALKGNSDSPGQYPIRPSEPPLPPMSVPVTKMPSGSDLTKQTETYAAANHSRYCEKFSDALEEFVREDTENGGNADARADVQLVVQFIIDQMGDPVVSDFDKARVEELDRMLPDIPNRRNIPKPYARTLSGRYNYAKLHGWEGLERLTEARLRNGYHNSLSKFFGWLIGKGYYPYDKPVFSHVSGENLVSLPRDSFDDAEVAHIFSQPLFVGCESARHIWKPGNYFVQSHIYWAYVLLLLTGLRPGELGQLELNDIQERDGIYYLYLRGFNPSKGRIAKKDLKRFKTPSSQRVVPLHPLILDLGLLERIEELREIGCPYLFPEWEPYVKPNGALRWGQPITKSWQYLKKVLKIERKDVTLYSTRHWFADLVDSTDIKDVTRKRLMGHSRKSDIPARYGMKHRLTTRDLAEIIEAKSPALDAIVPILLSAKEKAENKELIVLKPWLQRSNWSLHYRERIGEFG
ncbi:site-specific integrase [Oricola thermophila]|uniref:Site-specific integrase n=1 Tax=Oricola thermophila TaxID=2742145 RepID=A0A6N1V840_9HYPH|nr:site-specific integrase [Oricola thermophila]QKV17054.1 site-specific integrase [Oricola thermophila]